ncbi:hypothetical protein JCM8547_006467 [Rhodosporidiobolus lusitaniae]
MATQAVVSDPEPYEAVLGSTLNLSLLLVKHFRDVIKHGYAHWRTQPQQPPVLFDSLGASCFRLSSCLSKSSSLRIRPAVALSTTGTQMRNLIVHNGRSQREAFRWTGVREKYDERSEPVDLPVNRVHTIPFAPITQGVPLVGYNYRAMTLSQTLYHNPTTGVPLTLGFRIPKPHLLLYETLQAFAWSDHRHQARQVAFFRLLVLTEFGPFISTGGQQQDYVALYSNASLEEKRGIEQVERILSRVGEQEDVRLQVLWHMRREVTKEGRGLIWSSEDLTRRYTRALRYGQRMLRAAVASASSSSQSLGKRAYVPQARWI